MAKEKSLVEEAIIQMKNLEEAVAENAKGILASTMKQEIKDLVKESLSEQDEDEIDTDADVVDIDDSDVDDTDDIEDVDTDADNLGDEDDVMYSDSEDIIDLTKQSSSDVLKVFQLLGPEDQIVVTKDPNGNINLKDNETNKEYMIVGENIEEGDDYLNEYSHGDDLEEDMDFSQEVVDLSEDDWSTNSIDEDDNIDSIVEKVFGSDDEEYGININKFDIEDEDSDLDFQNEMAGVDYMSEDDLDGLEEDDLDGLEEDIMGDYGADQLGEDDNIVYEIEFNSDNTELDEWGHSENELMNYHFSNDDDDDDDDDDSESFEFDFDDENELPRKSKMDRMGFDSEKGGIFSEEDLEQVMESKKMSRKAPGLGMGKPKFKYDSKPNQDLPRKKQSYGGKGIGFGNAKKASKFNAEKDNGQMDGEFRVKPKKVETKEASRTYGNGSKSGRGLRKGITPNRNLTFENVDGREVQVLREKNEEYRKALNIFRNKLNEVAVFNSNLAYATRLFTEHSTSKQEKINILRRFDSVETIKESKNLYHQIKDELSVSSNQSSINESFERTIEKAPSTGSAVNLIESKTYENPQFLRMKDLMSKLR